MNISISSPDEHRDFIKNLDESTEFSELESHDGTLQFTDEFGHHDFLDLEEA